MNTQSRVSFPGFVLTKTKDTNSHEVEIGSIKTAGTVFVFEMIRNMRFDFLPFVVAKIMDESGTILWTFQQENMLGAGVLVHAEDTVVIALMAPGKFGKVQRVIPLSTLTSHEQPNLRLLVRLKVSAADYLQRDFELTSTEQVVYNAEQRRMAEERLKREEDRAQAREDEKAAGRQQAAARTAEKEARILRMLARGKITAYTSKGTRRTGIPVLASEWPSCTSGTFVIVVDSLDDDSKTIGAPLEAFQVQKITGRQPQKSCPALVSSSPPASPQPVVIRPVRTMVVENEAGAYEVQLYASMDHIREARAAGLNGGTFVAVDEKDAGGMIYVFAVRKDKIDSVGKFIPLA